MFFKKICCIATFVTIAQPPTIILESKTPIAQRRLNRILTPLYIKALEINQEFQATSDFTKLLNCYNKGRKLLKKYSKLINPRLCTVYIYKTQYDKFKQILFAQKTKVLTITRNNNEAKARENFYSYLTTTSSLIETHRTYINAHEILDKQELDTIAHTLLSHLTLINKSVKTLRLDHLSEQQKLEVQTIRDDVNLLLEQVEEKGIRNQTNS